MVLSHPRIARRRFAALGQSRRSRAGVPRRPAPQPPQRPHALRIDEEPRGAEQHRRRSVSTPRVRPRVEKSRRDPKNRRLVAPRIPSVFICVSPWLNCLVELPRPCYARTIMTTRFRFLTVPLLLSALLPAQNK